MTNAASVAVGLAAAAAAASTSSAAVVKPSTAKYRVTGAVLPGTRHHHSHVNHHAATAFNDRDIQRRLQAFEEAADGSDEMAASAYVTTVFRTRDASTLYSTATPAAAGTSGISPTVACMLSRGKHRSPWNGTGQPVNRRISGSGAGIDGWTSNVDDICPWPAPASLVDQTIRIYSKRSAAAAAADVSRDTNILTEK